jgi:hypothetical protein
MGDPIVFKGTVEWSDSSISAMIPTRETRAWISGPGGSSSGIFAGTGLLCTLVRC